MAVYRLRRYDFLTLNVVIRYKMIICSAGTLAFVLYSSVPRIFPRRLVRVYNILIA